MHSFTHRIAGRIAFAVLLTVAVFLGSNPARAEVRIGTFRTDVTIPLGHRCMGILETKALQIDDPLELVGLVLTGAGAPIVLVALDWCEIRNGAYDQWRDRIAEAVSTSRQRVLVSSLHQHDAPVTDLEAQRYLDSVGLAGELYDVDFHDDCIAQAVIAIKAAVAKATPATHLSIGQARVNNIASNRRVLHPDGVARYDRYSRTSPDSLQAKSDTGEIDPMLKSLSFWNGERQIATVSAYATHPMSYYGKGGVSADFVGLARRRRQVDTPNTLQIYVTGCSGDVTAGKYNDGSPTSRAALTERLYRAMTAADANAVKHPISEPEFRCESLNLPFHEGAKFSESAMVKVLQQTDATVANRILAAMGLSSLRRLQRGQATDLPCVDFGIAQIVLFPGESFVGYQRMAQQMRPDSFVMCIGFGECWTGYIPTSKAFDEGFGHDWRWVGRGCEAIIRAKLEKLLADDRR